MVHALGTVTPIASVAIKARLETSIVGVTFRRRRRGQEGRSAVHPRQPADRGADRAGRRHARRAKRAARQAPSATSSATPIWSPRMPPPRSPISTTPRPRSMSLSAAIKAEQGAARKSEGAAQLLHHPRADRRPHQLPPMSRSAISCAPADTAPLATINQIAPIYVSFTVPQRILPGRAARAGRRDRDRRSRPFPANQAAARARSP